MSTIHKYRTHNCAQLRLADQNRTVKLCGWVHRIRNHGDLYFVDLRDDNGITQCISNIKHDVFKKVTELTPECVVQISGDVVPRSQETINSKIPTGEIEVLIVELSILNKVEDLPLPVFNQPNFPEETRLRYRYLDLRRTRMHQNIKIRSQVIRDLRDSMHNAGFTEFQTPILTASSPEGARDFLVPSRLHQGKFYALPQAPQIFKQLAMCSGFEKYFQIAPCFRDEDARTDRSPGEFYQLDIEMAFATQEDVFETIEPILIDLFKKHAPEKALPTPFPRIPYKQVMEEYASDKPDLRNPLKYKNVSKYFIDSGFNTFSKPLKNIDNFKVIGMKAPNGGTRKFCDQMNKWAREQGQPGMGYIIWQNGESKGPIAKALGETVTDLIKKDFNVNDGDAILFIAGKSVEIQQFANNARKEACSVLGCLEENIFRFCWIVDFPFYEWDYINNKLAFGHNPFSMPQANIEEMDNSDALEILAWQYDIVCNGFELSSGAVRNHSREMMLKVFSKIGYDSAFIEKNFNCLWQAFAHGAPPHAGIAPGIDRIVMLLLDEQNIREVTMFPMNQNAQDLMLAAPATVDQDHLKELGLMLAPKQKN